MRGRSLRVGTVLVVLVVLGCTPGPTPSPSVTPPPIPADFVPWPDIGWHLADLPPRPPGSAAERVVAITATPDSFVAVGYREINGSRDGVVWRSIDGEAWQAIDGPLFADAELIDVSPAPGGIVALGTLSIGDGPPQAVVFRSTDGEAWERLAPPVGGVGTFPSSLAGDTSGVLVTGDDNDGKAVVWRSIDGRSFQSLPVDEVARDAVESPRVVGGGYAALGPAGGPPILLRSTDGSSWTTTSIDQASDVVGTRLEIGRWGWIVQGIWAPGCGPLASCAGRAIAWWSGDGTTWARLPVEGSPISTGGSIVVPAGAHGMLAITGADAWSSPDGWAWRSLAEPGDGTVGVDDAVVRGDLIVAVGAENEEDGSSVGRILVAR
jgi:hypothetical protein